MIVAWLVHLYTATGLILALLATRAVIDFNYRAAFFWLWLQVVIDATDGFLARRSRVAERIPWFDGGKLDDVVDYLTYVFVPALFVWRAGRPGRAVLHALLHVALSVAAAAAGLLATRSL